MIHKYTTMEDYLNNYQLSNGSKSIATRATEKFNVKRIGKVMEKEPIEELTMEDLRGDNLDLLISRLCGQYELKTILATLYSCRNLMEYKGATRDDIGALMTFIKEFDKTNKDEYAKQKPNKLRQENYIDFPTLETTLLEKIGDDISAHTAKELEALITLGLYVLIPPRRLGDYGMMEYRDESKMKRKPEHLPKDKNYIVHNGNGKYRFVINNYKNARRGQEEQMGQYSGSINSELLNSLIHYNFENHNTKRKFLLPGAKGTGSNPHTLGLRLKRYSKKYIGKELTCDSFRHIFLTHYHKHNANKSILEKKEALAQVGQTYVPPINELYVDMI